jgi:hypothetical protein
MPKMWTLALVLLISAAWLQAQESPSGSSQSGSSQTAAGQTGSAGARQASVEGCLQGSNGNFTLTDSSGTTYQLEGNTSKLSEHVGHEVQVTGTPSKSSAGTGANSNSAMAPGESSGSRTLTVEKVKHISKTCKSSK